MVEPSAKKVVEPFNIHLDAFWEHDLKNVERMIRKLDEETLKKLYGMTINITDEPFFPHPKTGEPMVGDTRYFRGKPYLIILGKDPTPRILYHEVAHAIGIEDETEAMNFAKEKERADNPVPEEYSTCYEDAWRFLIKEEEGELIHGTVESLGRRIGHAWVELPTGFIWEPQTKSYFSIKDFDIAASPIEEHRYTVEEAAIMLSRVGKHGPWTKEEREQFLKRDNPAESRLEPWQMTLEQYAVKKGARPAWVKAGYGETYRFHKRAVERAIREGKPVPAEVLRDYPELEGGNPRGKIITKEEAIGLLERLSMTPGEAARSLVADEAERREIMQTVQQRVKREQNKWAPMDPRKGPPLPRIFAGLRWPWKK